MINIASSQPVHWPTAPAPTVAPVTAVTAVAPAQRTQGDGQSSLGSQRDSRSGEAREKRSAKDTAGESLQAAPLLPRDSSAKKSDLKPAASIDSVSARERAQEAEAAKEEAATKTLKLMEVLSTVWRASAAVVEGALGIDASNAAKAGARGTLMAEDRVAGASLNGQRPGLSNTENAGFGSDPQDPLLGRAAGEPVAYTEQGTSTWMALEPGQLLSKQA
ncbi:MAG: hypothetical protein WEK74_16005 [Hydrogenophaga sp.]